MNEEQLGRDSEKALDVTKDSIGLSGVSRDEGIEKLRGWRVRWERRIL